MFSKNIEDKLEEKGLVGLNAEGILYKNLSKEEIEGDIHDITITVKAYEEITYEEIEIAEVKVCIFPFVDKAATYFMFDNLSSELEKLGVGLGLLKKTTPKITRNMQENGWIFYIDRWSVLAEYRGIGIGTEILEQLPEWIEDLTGIWVPNIALIPGAFEISPDDERRKDADERLVAFYKRNGYRKMRNANVMYKSFI